MTNAYGYVHKKVYTIPSNGSNCHLSPICLMAMFVMSKVVILKNSPHFSNVPSSNGSTFHFQVRCCIPNGNFPPSTAGPGRLFSAARPRWSSHGFFVTPKKDKVENSPTKIVVPSGKHSQFAIENGPLK